MFDVRTHTDRPVRTRSQPADATPRDASVRDARVPEADGPARTHRPAGDVLARTLAGAVAGRASAGPLLQRLRLTALDTTVGGTKPTTKWGMLAAKVVQYDAAVRALRPYIVRLELLDEVERLLRGGKALETGFRGVRHRDARAAKRAAGQRLLTEITSERVALQAERQAMVATFGGLGAETWREYVDVRVQHFGSAVYDSGLHGKNPEVGYVPSIAAAHKFARDHLGERMTVDFYERLQALARAHNKDPATKDWSPYTDHVDVDVAHAGPAFQSTIRDAWATGRPAKEVYEIVQATGLPFGDTFTTSNQPGKVKFSFHYEGKNEVNSRARIQKLFDDFYAALGTLEDPLPAISLLHKQLEYMHPFLDANTRTNLVVLNKLLVECGYNPVVLDNPNLSYAQTVQEWETHLRHGMRRWWTIRSAPMLAQTVEQAMQDFDVGENTPQAHALKPRAGTAADLNVDFTN